MTIRFELTIDDLIAFGFYNRKNGSRIKKAISLLPVIMLLIILIATLYYYFFLQELIVFDTSNIALIIFLLAYTLSKTKWFYSWYWKYKYGKKEYASWFGERILTFSETSLFAKTSRAETSYNWNSFVKFGESKEYFFLFVSNLQAIIIPKKVFLLSQEQYDIKLFIERKLTENNSKS
ncbi:hypothetical protein F0919_11650 [Taibaiella lutea]|uniref:YcxB-like C-terminal domain-containing protein n=1 Tax=Taibaiella lutea TaxID=2608001 RepID=A0A5M6CII0_9BACT|nr:YcxB family protein [Taibaiella lutea]KAA5533195.1 hypothetical protein F0919_11650 [Taibaiella lutea]